LYNYNSSNLEDAWRTTKITKPIEVIQTNPILGIQNWSSLIAKPVETAVSTINSAMAFKESLQKPKGKQAMNSLW